MTALGNRIYYILDFVPATKLRNTDKFVGFFQDFLYYYIIAMLLVKNMHTA